MWDGVGQRLGGYDVEAAVGVGSTGTVWRARQRDLGRSVAIKTLADGVRVDVLRAEAAVLATLDHPNIVRVYDFAEAGRDQPGDPAWLAEEWVDGERIDELVARLNTPLSGEQAVGVLRGALQGLAYAHERSVIHGDVAPGNILIDTTGTSRLVDFGLSRPSGSAGSAATTGFSAPETLAGASVTAASDVYSSAAVLRYLLGDGATGRLAEIIARATAEHPPDRPQNAGELLGLLEEAARDRYGAAWLARASVAGLVSAPAATAVGMSVAGSGGAPAAAAAEAVHTDAESTGLDRIVSKRKVPRPAVAGGGVLVVAGAIIIAVLASGSHKKATAAAAPLVTPPPAANVPAGATVTSPPPKNAVTLSGQLAGTYTLTTVVTASEISAEPAGTRFENATWTIGSCTGSPCHVHIVSSSGHNYDALFDGSVLTMTFTDQKRTACVDDNGQPVPGVTALATNVLRYRTTVTGLGTKPALSGVANVVQSYSDPQGGSCTLAKPVTEVRKLIGVRHG